MTVGKAVLPVSGDVVPGGAWLRALRTLLDELVRPVTAIGRWARDEVAAAWARAGSSLDARQGLTRRPYEQLLPDQRVSLLRVAAAAVSKRGRPPGSARRCPGSTTLCHAMGQRRGLQSLEKVTGYVMVFGSRLSEAIQCHVIERL